MSSNWTRNLATEPSLLGCYALPKEIPEKNFRSSISESYFLTPNAERAWNAVVDHADVLLTQPIHEVSSSSAIGSNAQMVQAMQGIPTSSHQLAVTRPQVSSSSSFGSNTQLVQAMQGIPASSHQLAVTRPQVSSSSAIGSNAQLVQAMQGITASSHQLAVTRPQDSSSSAIGSNAQPVQAMQGIPSASGHQLAVTRPQVSTSGIGSNLQQVPVTSGQLLAPTRSQVFVPYNGHQSYTIELVNVAPGIQIPKKKLVSRFLPSPVKDQGRPIRGRGPALYCMNPDCHPDPGAISVSAAHGLWSFSGGVATGAYGRF